MSFKKRYILAQEAEERIVSLFRKERNDAADIFNTAIDACQSIILDMYDNASDAVEVVRCKYCEFYYADEKWCRRLGLCGAFDADGYCAHGERREK